MSLNGVCRGCSLDYLNWSDPTAAAAATATATRTRPGSGLHRVRPPWLLAMLRLGRGGPLLSRRRAQSAFDVVCFLQPRVEVARARFCQLDAQRPLLALQPNALDVAIEALLGVVAAAVDGALIAPALLENFLDSLDERCAFLSIEHTGGDPLWGFRLGFICFRLAAGDLLGGDFRGGYSSLLSAFCVGLLVGFLLGGGLCVGLSLGLSEGA